MEGVTAAIVAFLFVCVVFPNVIKKKPKFYAALACVILVIFLSGLNVLLKPGGVVDVSYFIICLLQIAAIILLILAAGGLTFKQLLTEVNEAIDSVRSEASGAEGKTSAPQSEEKMTG
jgi:hypothetical protein